MRWIILLATATIAIPFTIGFLAPNSGAAVSERFLERPVGIPGEPSAGPAPLNAETLRAWAFSEKTKGYAHIYAWRVIPIDLVYLFAFGGFLAFAAYALASSEIAPGNVLGKVPVMLWLAFPALYVVTDLLEDILIMRLLSNPETIVPRLVNILSGLRWTKIVASGLSLLQLFVLGLGGAIRMT